jgi:hypothetical protein
MLPLSSCDPNAASVPSTIALVGPASEMVAPSMWHPASASAHGSARCPKFSASTQKSPLKWQVVPVAAYLVLLPPNDDGCRTHHPKDFKAPQRAFLENLCAHISSWAACLVAVERVDVREHLVIARVYAGTLDVEATKAARSSSAQRFQLACPLRGLLPGKTLKRMVTCTLDGDQ